MSRRIATLVFCVVALILGISAHNAQAASFDSGSSDITGLGKVSIRGPDENAHLYQGDIRGDVNGDNIDDIVVGAPEADPLGRSDAGVAYVIFGRRGISGSIDTVGIGANQGFAIYGNSDAALGKSVAITPDINGDGKDEIIAGAPEDDRPRDGDVGRVWVIFGKSDGSTVDTTRCVAGGQSRCISMMGGDRDSFPFEANDKVGFSVAGGDVDGDGIGDIVAGAPGGENYFDEDNSGLVYIIYGFRRMGDPNFEAPYGPIDLNCTCWWENRTPSSGRDGPPGRYYGRVLSGADTGDDLGWSVAVVPGSADSGGGVLAGAPDANTLDTNSAAGVAYFVPAGNRGGNLNLEDNSNLGVNMRVVNGREGCSPTCAASEDLGTSVSDAGDVNHDGLRDFIVGAPDANSAGRDEPACGGLGCSTGRPDAGTAYLVFGTSAVNQNFDIRTRSWFGTGKGIEIAGSEWLDEGLEGCCDADPRAGAAVGYGGDLNQDGYADVLVGAPGQDTNGNDGGSVFAVFGRETHSDIDSNEVQSGALVDLQGSPGSENFFDMRGEGDDSLLTDEEEAGSYVSGGGDVDGDGKMDVLIGSAGYNTTGDEREDAGVIHIVTANQHQSTSPSGGGGGGATRPSGAGNRPVGTDGGGSGGTTSGNSGTTTSPTTTTPKPPRCPTLASSKPLRSKALKLRKKLKVRLQAPSTLRSGTGSGKALIRLVSTTKKGKKLLKKTVRSVTFRRGVKKLTVDRKYPFTAILRNDLDPGTYTIKATLRMKKKGKAKTLKLKIKLAAPCG